jgi:MFS family permease
VLVAAVAIAMSGFTTAAQYSVVTDRFGLPSVFLGLLASAQGAGSIAGGLGVGRLLTRFGPTAVAAIGAVVFAAGCLTRCLPWSSALPVGSVLIGIGLPWTLIAGVTAVQVGTPDEVLGRVAATSTALMFGPNALAIPLGGAAVHVGGIPPYVFAAALCFAAAVRAVRSGPGDPGGDPLHDGPADVGHRAGLRRRQRVEHEVPHRPDVAGRGRLD